MHWQVGKIYFADYECRLFSRDYWVYSIITSPDFKLGELWKVRSVSFFFQVKKACCNQRDTPHEAAVSYDQIVTKSILEESFLCTRCATPSFLWQPPSLLQRRLRVRWVVASFVQYKHVCTKWFFAVSLQCLAHHSVRLWCSPRRLASPGDQPRADSLELSRSLASFLGKMAVFDETNPLDWRQLHTYAVATISRLLKSKGLFCKRAL